MTAESIDTDNLTKDEIMADATFQVIAEMNDIEIERYKAKLFDRAKQLGVKTHVEAIFKKFMKDRAKYRKKMASLSVGGPVADLLDRNTGGDVEQTIENYLKVMNNDEYFESLKYNELSNGYEHTKAGKIIRWTDADDSAAKHYLELRYGLSNTEKYNDALRIKFNTNRYHPIKDLIESVKWDGKERIATFLPRWMECDNNAYTQEVSRLIFAGGIHRLYNPGCKFDDMPVLIGTKQGEGKSTFVRWLAMRDEFYREVNEIDGQKGIEAIEGGWICEMSELLALTRAKEVEAVKSYITRCRDSYRRPYDKWTTENPRQCIFIGTTNKEQFLTDKSGNRRFYPVRVKQSGYLLFTLEEEIKAEIVQCWAEAKAKLGTDEMKPFASLSLIDDIRVEQSKALEYDYREDLIRDYISTRKEVSVLELWENALDETGKPRKIDSNAIVQILRASPGGWEDRGPKWVELKSGKRKVRVWARSNDDGYDYGDETEEF